jgi:hypothetical protein
MDLHSTFLFAPTGARSAGRVNLNPFENKGGNLPPSAFQYPTTPDSGAAVDLIRGNYTATPVSDSFFSVSNMNYLQHAMKRAVYERSGPRKWDIDDQSIDELKVIMRAMYLQYGRNDPTQSVKDQVAELNSIVVEWAVPRIMSEIEAYLHYLNDISTMPVPMTHPVNMSTAGTKSGTFNRFF